MNRRTKWILFTAVVLAISILWPLSYMLSHSRAGQKNPGGNNETGPITITPVETYQGQANVTVESLEPRLFAVGYANAGSREELEGLISSWKGVKSVKVTRTQASQSKYMYRFDIAVNLTNSSLDEKIGFWLTRLLPIHVESVLAPVKLEIPGGITLQNRKTGEVRAFNISSNAKEFAYYYTKPGNTTAYVLVQVSGEKVKNALVIAGSPFYIPPMSNVFTSIDGKIVKVEKGVILGNTTQSLNETNLSKEWNATVRLFPHNNTTSLRAEFAPERMDEMKGKVGQVANITDAYYLARVEIPENITVDGKEKKVPTRYVDDVKVYKTKGNVTFLARISEAFGIIVGVSYGGEY